MRAIFDTHGTDSEWNCRSGQQVEIIRPLTETECDIAEVGKMYKVRFDDGTETDAFEDELSKIKFFEIEFDHNPRMRDTDNCGGDYSICILAEREPSYEEAEQFCKKDMEQMGYEYVVGIFEINEEGAKDFYDMENMDKFPVFK